MKVIFSPTKSLPKQTLPMSKSRLPQTERAKLAKRVHTRLGCLGLGTLKAHASFRSETWEKCGFSAAERQAILETHDPIPCVACNMSRSKNKTNKAPPEARYWGHLTALAADLSGPLPVTPTRGNTKGGFDRFLVIVCKGTGVRHVYLLRGKESETVLCYFKGLISLSKRNGKTGTTEVTIDGGGEFAPASFSKWWKSKGIEFRMSAPYQHWQNGYPESSMGFLKTRTRTALVQSGLKPENWDLAVLHSADVYNATATRLVIFLPDGSWVFTPKAIHQPC